MFLSLFLYCRHMQQQYYGNLLEDMLKSRSNLLSDIQPNYKIAKSSSDAKDSVSYCNIIPQMKSIELSTILLPSENI